METIKKNSVEILELKNVITEIKCYQTGSTLDCRKKKKLSVNLKEQ